MQGRKDFTPKLFYELSLDSLVPKDDFNRKVNKYLDLHFLYKATEKYYGSEGQQSIDPVVFFKILLVGYLNNINSDRALLRYCSDSLSVRLFLGYDLDEDGEEIRPKYLSNHTHYSPTDPDAKISTKPGKPRQLNYAGQLAVDD